MKIENLEDLFNHTLEDVYFAETRLVKALPKMAKASDSPALAKAFMGHLEETKEHVTRLEQVFKMLNRKAKATECPAIKGILEEGEDLMKDIKDADTRDAAMIAAGQAAEHYEITRYGTLISWANLLGHKDVAAILEKTLKEEYARRRQADRACREPAQQRSGVSSPDARLQGKPARHPCWFFLILSRQRRG